MKNNNNNQNKKKTKTKQSLDVPAAETNVKKTNNPKIITKKGEIRIKHKELVLNFSTNANGALSFSTPLEPTNSLLFPWLSGMSALFQNYRFESFDYEFIPAVPTTTAGQYLMAFDPNNVQADPFPSFAKQGAQLGAKETQIWNGTKMHLTSKQLNNIGPRKLVRNLGTATSPDNACGVLYFLLTSNFLSQVPGSLWVHYDIVLNYPTAEHLSLIGGVGEFETPTNSLAITQLSPTIGSNFTWGYLNGFYQGFALKEGSYLITWRIILAGGGTTTSMSQAIVDAALHPDSNITDIAEYVGVNSDLSFVVNVARGDSIQCNFTFTTSGTVTNTGHLFSIASAPLGSLVY